MRIRRTCAAFTFMDADCHVCNCFSVCFVSFVTPYPKGDSITPYPHSFHTVGRVWGALRTGIPSAPWGQRTMGENGE